jgi:Flp pilus assembly protein TadG
MSEGARGVRGQSLVEFALILPLFVLLLVGLFDVGRAVYAYNTVNNAAREAGRLAIVDQYEPHIKDEAVAAAAGVNVVHDDVVVTYRRPDGSNCTALGTDAVVGCVAQVRVTHRYTAALPLIGNLIGTMEITGESRFPVSINCATSTCPLGS